jgi:hypothetical protein
MVNLLKIKNRLVNAGRGLARTSTSLRQVPIHDHRHLAQRPRVRMTRLMLAEIFCRRL